MELEEVYEKNKKNSVKNLINDFFEKINWKLNFTPEELKSLEETK
jgi:hypothetical protein